MTMIQDPQTGKFRQSLVNDPEFLSAIQGLQSFVLDTEADFDTAYEWVCDQANVHTFVADEPAWHMFYKTFVDA